jgi:hypothetical protein
MSRRSQRWIGGRLLVVACCVVLSALGMSCSSALAAEVAAPGYRVFGYAFPAENLPPGGEGLIVLHVLNEGAAAVGGLTLEDTLPEGLVALAAEGSTSGFEGCSGVGTRVLVCHLGAVQPQETIGEVDIPVSVAGSAHGEALDRVRVFGGGAAVVSSSTFPVRFSAESAGLGYSNIGAWAFDQDGRVDTQAASHPYQFTFAFAFNTHQTRVGEWPLAAVETGNWLPIGGEERRLDVKLPPGFTADTTAVPQCPRALFDIGSETGGGCPADTQIGTDTFELHGHGPLMVRVYNVVPPPGVAMEFGFGIGGQGALLDARLRSGGNYGFTVETNNFIQLGVTYNALKLWGTPAEKSHDVERTSPTDCIPDEHGQCGVSIPVKPLLRLPTSCGAPLAFGAEIIGTWESESARGSGGTEFENESGEPAGLTGCERLVNFDPTASFTPESSFGDTASGLTADIQVPQGGNPEGLATSGLENTTVTFPEGLVLNPGQATGLVACQPSQENLGGPEAEQEGDDAPPACPAASKVGSAEITSPSLPDKLLGSVYVLGQNPPNVQLLVAASGDGVNIKLIGNVHLDATTGRLTSTFQDTPDLPFTDFKLTFNGGQQAAVVTPGACGTYESKAVFTPWSDPLEEIQSASEFQITAGPGGSACSAPGFSPGFQAGTVVNQAGGYSPVSVTISHQDGEQALSGIQVSTPPGLLAILNGVERCGEPQASQGTCGAGSLIGHTTVTAGPGAYPLVVPGGQVFLTGPYKGAPFGLSIVVPAIAGPFNLGDVVVRAKVEVDPQSGQITIASDPLPTILDGVPLQLKSVNVDIDRQGFTFNPTSCAPMTVNGVLTSTQGTQAGVSNRFQAADCASLAFHPSFAVSTQAKTSKAKGASLLVKVGSGAGQANIAKAAVSLPKQLPSRLTTIQQACPEATFNANPASCPAGSDVGTGTVRTPVLANPLTGPAYLVSHGGAAFPDLVVILQGEGVTLDLTGSINIKGGVTSSSFESVPDAPVTSFELSLPEGSHSALATDIPSKAKGSLCGQSLTMPTTLTGQNGAQVKQSTKIAVTGCPKAKAKKKAKKSKVKKKHGRAQAKKKGK